MSEKLHNKQISDEKVIIEIQEMFSEVVVDLTLIRWMLSLTPEERLKTLQNNIWSLMRLKNGVIKA